MEMAYGNVSRRCFSYDTFSIASKIFLENRIDHFESESRRLIYEFRDRLNSPRNSSHLLNDKCGMVNFWITTNIGKWLYV